MLRSTTRVRGGSSALQGDNVKLARSLSSGASETCEKDTVIPSDNTTKFVTLANPAPGNRKSFFLKGISIYGGFSFSLKKALFSIAAQHFIMPFQFITWKWPRSFTAEFWDVQRVDHRLSGRIIACMGIK